MMGILVIWMCKIIIEVSCNLVELLE